VHAELQRLMSSPETTVASPTVAAAAPAPAGHAPGLRWAWGIPVLVLVLAGYLIVRPRLDRPPAPAGSNAVRSIAVLPLDNYSGDPAQDYFAEGMTDEMTADLATISHVLVTSRGAAIQL